MITLGCTVALGVESAIWLLPTVVSNIILWAYLGYAVSKVSYVRYHD